MKPKNKKTIEHKNDSLYQTFIKRIERLSAAGKLFILCAIASVIFGWLMSYIDGVQTEESSKTHFSEILKIRLEAQSKINESKDSARDKEIELRDSLNRKDNQIIELQRKEQVAGVQKSVDNANSKLASKSFQYDTLSLKLQAAHKENELLQKEFNSPVITESVPLPNENNPTLVFDSSQHRYVFTINIINSGKGIASDIRVKSNMLYTANGVDFISVIQGGGDYFDKYMKLEEGGQYGYLIFVQPNKSINFISIEVKYKNSFNEERPPYRNIYYFNYDLVNKPITRINRYEKKNVESYLLYNKIWEDK